MLLFRLSFLRKMRGGEGGVMRLSLVLLERLEFVRAVVLERVLCLRLFVAVASGLIWAGKS